MKRLLIEGLIIGFLASAGYAEKNLQTIPGRNDEVRSGEEVEIFNVR